MIRSRWALAHAVSVEVSFRKQCTSDYCEKVDISVGSMVGLIVRNQKPVQTVESSESTMSSILVVALVRRPTGAKETSVKAFTVYRRNSCLSLFQRKMEWWTEAACTHSVCLCWLTTRYVQGQRVCSMRIYLSCMKKFGRTESTTCHSGTSLQKEVYNWYTSRLFIKAGQNRCIGYFEMADGSLLMEIGWYLSPLNYFKNAYLEILSRCCKEPVPISNNMDGIIFDWQ